MIPKEKISGSTHRSEWLGFDAIPVCCPWQPASLRLKLVNMDIDATNISTSSPNVHTSSDLGDFTSLNFREATTRCALQLSRSK